MYGLVFLCPLPLMGLLSASKHGSGCKSSSMLMALIFVFNLGIFAALLCRSLLCSVAGLSPARRETRGPQPGRPAGIWTGSPVPAALALGSGCAGLRAGDSPPGPDSTGAERPAGAGSRGAGWGGLFCREGPGGAGVRAPGRLPAMPAARPSAPPLTASGVQLRGAGRC